VVAQHEQKVGQLKTKSTLENSGLVIPNAPTKFQVISQDQWIAIEVAGLCRSGLGRNDLEGSKSRGRIVFTDSMAWSHLFESGDANEPKNL
jgi:hypothetical protein